MDVWAGPPLAVVTGAAVNVRVHIFVRKHLLLVLLVETSGELLGPVGSCW